MSGVPDQMKILGITGKNADDRNIPWSQQVDEASYENLASPTSEEQTVNLTSMQFQYPPFNAKETPNVSWNSHKSNKKYGKPAFYSNNSKRDEFQPSIWNPNSSRRGNSDVFGNFSRTHKSDESYENEKLNNRPYDNVEEKRHCAPPPISVPKKTTWASIASQPAKLTSRSTLNTATHKKKGPGMPPPPMVPGKHNLDVNTWDVPNNNPPPVPSPPPLIDYTYPEINQGVSPHVEGSFENSIRSEIDNKGLNNVKDENNINYISNNFGRIRTSPNGHLRKNWQTSFQQNRIAGTTMRRGDNTGSNRFNERKSYNNTRFEQENSMHESREEIFVRNTERVCSINEMSSADSSQTVLEELCEKNNYNPTEIDLEKAALARFFVIKSYSEDDIHRSIKYEIWCSTDHGNKRLDDAFKERHKEGGHVLLFFSVNGSGHFCGMAQMMTAVDYNSTSSVWSQDKWKGKFKVKWIYVKDVPNPKLRHICLENNDNKSVTNSRDTQEVPNAKGIDVLQILHSFKHSTSIFDDFYHYEKKQEEEVSSKKPLIQDNITSPSQLSMGRNIIRQNEDRSGQQKYFNSSSHFRDRNNMYRGGQSNYNDNRRFDAQSHRAPGHMDSQYKEREDVNREENEHSSSRKFDYRSHSKHSNRDYSDDQNKLESRFRLGQRDIQKDNEYQSERIRGVDY